LWRTTNATADAGKGYLPSRWSSLYQIIVVDLTGGDRIFRPHFGCLNSEMAEESHVNNLLIIGYTCRRYTCNTYVTFFTFFVVTNPKCSDCHGISFHCQLAPPPPCSLRRSNCPPKFGQNSWENSGTGRRKSGRERQKIVEQTNRSFVGMPRCRYATHGSKWTRLAELWRSTTWNWRTKATTSVSSIPPHSRSSRQLTRTSMSKVRSLRIKIYAVFRHFCVCLHVSLLAEHVHVWARFVQIWSNNNRPPAVAVYVLGFVCLCVCV